MASNLMCERICEDGAVHKIARINLTSNGVKLVEISKIGPAVKRMR